MFIGQKRVILELLTYSSAIQKGENFNILVFAPSGYGKTSIVKSILDGKFKYSFYLGKLPTIINDRIIVIDECHLVASNDNFEKIYPYMDDGKHSFILMSNILDGIPEAVKTRCIIVKFDPYTKEDIGKIYRQFLPHISVEMSEKLAVKSLLNPRITIHTARRLKTVARENKVTDENIESLLDKIGFKDFEPLTQIYVDFLKERKRASFESITRATGLSKDIVLSIEQYLLKLGLVEISSRGREWRGDP